MIPYRFNNGAIIDIDDIAKIEPYTNKYADAQSITIYHIYNKSIQKDTLCINENEYKKLIETMYSIYNTYGSWDILTNKKENIN